MTRENIGIIPYLGGTEINQVIVEIIRQDMRFNQFIHALQELGFEVYDFDLDLMGVVARLMNIKEEDISDAWIDLYVKELSKSERISIDSLGQNLYPLAEECYKALMDFSGKWESEKDKVWT